MSALPRPSPKWEQFCAPTHERRYNATDFSDTVGRIHNAVPDVAITADVIAGFPGETDSDFRDTVDMCVESELASVHVFPYSIRPRYERCVLQRAGRCPNEDGKSGRAVCGGALPFTQLQESILGRQ